MDTNEIFLVISDTVLRVSRCLYSRPSKALFSFSQFRPQIVQLLAFLPNNGQKAAKLNPGRTKRRLTRLAGGNGQRRSAPGGGKGEARLTERAKTGGDKTGKGEVRLGRGQNRQRRNKLGREDERGASLARGKLGRGAKLDER